MKIKSLILICLFPIVKASAQNEAYFLSQPSLTPDGQSVVFCFDGDIWKANIADGQAERLTAMRGYETNPKVSPDGKWIAFTGRQFGNADVYIMPSNGGEIKRLTYFSGTDDVSSWGWDSKTIYFTSSRLSRTSTYKVNISGGTAVPVFNRNFFLNDHNLFENPITGELFFNDTWESSNQVHRKRYKGPYNPDIQSYNPTAKTYKRYTTWIGKDFGATIDKFGNVYFISDSTNGEYNLYTLQNGKSIPLTNFSTSIKTASVNAEGGYVVFEKDYQLWLYDVASKKAKKLNISIYKNSVLGEQTDYNVKGKISSFDVAPDGKKIAFISRGQLFVSDAEGKFTQQLDAQSPERKSEVKWLADNKTLIYSQTDNGYQNWFTLEADKPGSTKQITHDKMNDRLLALNKKRTKGVYLSGRNGVCTIDLKSFECKTVVTDEIWGVSNNPPGFSPDGEYIIYNAIRNFEQDIFVHNLKTGKTINLTKTGISESTPIWSPDGRYIYFTSSRFKPSFPEGDREPHVYRLPLQKFDSAFLDDKYHELFTDADKKDTSGPEIVTTIDTNKIMDRIESVGPSFGSQSLINVYEKDGATIVLYISTQLDGKPNLYKTVFKKFDEPKTEKINDAEGGDMTVTEAKEKYFLLSDGIINKLNLEGNKAEPINISYVFRKNLQQEFTQIFYELWAQVQENYYDENFHGLNWENTKKEYEKYVPCINNRGDLRILLNDMLGELNSSHQGFNTFGDEEQVLTREKTMETGIIFEENDPYKVKYVLNNTAADKVNVNIKPGDILKKVNDAAVDETQDRYYYFTKPSVDKELALTFDRKGKTITTRLHPQTAIMDELYDEWIDKNEKYVNEKSSNRIAYICMKNMGGSELDHFIEKMTEDLPGKDAVILDLRYNTGGNVHDEVLQFLSQRSYMKWKYREGQFAKQPDFAPDDKPIILLVNEQTLSDGEVTAQGFKALKLGTIIGNETYHWIIFTGGVEMVDGSTVRLPSWGCYTLEGKDLELNGVSPDIKVINTFEDKINERDPQLQTAIDEINRKLVK